MDQQNNKQDTKGKCLISLAPQQFEIVYSKQLLSDIYKTRYLLLSQLESALPSPASLSPLSWSKKKNQEKKTTAAHVAEKHLSFTKLLHWRLFPWMLNKCLLRKYNLC